MLVPAINSTDDPPISIHDLQLREYVFALRRRIEVQNVLLESLAEEIKGLKQERDGLSSHIERLLLDLHWLDSKRNIRE
jgi:hypothetical protein